MRHDIYFQNNLELSLQPEALAVLARINQNLKHIMNELDDLTAQVKQNTDVTQSALVLIQGLKTKLDAAGTDPAKLKALRDELAASDTALASAVTANTPAEPGTPPV